MKTEFNLLVRYRLKIFLIAVGFAMLLFPPWINTFTRPGAAVVKSSAGYGFLFSPPEPQREALVFGVELDVARLVVQLMLLAGAFGVLAYAKKSR